MRRVFIPNRGEIAVRIVAACRGLDLECVVGASEADMDGMAAELADAVVCIGPAPPAESYLCPDKVVEAALGAGCDAIHPGYGFLSESPRLAALARDSGLSFVGPPTPALEVGRDKPAARREAAEAGAAILPGGEVATPAQARALAAEIGYPLLIKASAGQEGRGIRRVEDATELNAQLRAARREAGAAVGDDRLYLERLIAPARHVEVQIAGDERGRTIGLGERDCSVQRRFQKVVEEAPALPDAVSGRLAESALAVARRIGYRNLGTVEFLVDAETGEPYFLEMSCRIAAEHPVTEAVTGLDLVAMQLRIAAGGRVPAGLTQGIRFSGHAIECRLTAQDPARGYMPTPGTLSLFSVPERHHLRVDTHCRAGAVVPPYYDPLLAKLIGHGQDRDQAIDLLLDVLEDLDVEGVETNRTLLISLLGHPDFRRGLVTTDWLERALR